MTERGAQESAVEAVGLERRRLARKAARRNSGLVRLLRILFPLLGVAILVAIAGLIFLYNVLNSLGIGNVILTSEGLVMDRPELSGHDGERSYKVSAVRAIQRITDPRIIDLETITAEIVLGPDQRAAITATKGTYNNGAETLSLSEGIELDWSGTYQVHFESVDVDLRTGTVRTSDPLQINSQQGDIQAGRFAYDQDKGLVRFTDGIKMVLRPGAQEKTK
ncbi:LPS export ABC transporter periplasmic protein LptC [Polymorphum gilvum]|nr:LPS export ABC transporter periplasmic protein LptC [Polymorphum gilvum]